MNKSILITGVGGSGKSLVCKELKKLRYKAYDIENIKGMFTMINKKTKKVAKNYDDDNIELVKQHDWICDKKKLKQLIKKNSKETRPIFYCGIASNLLKDLFSLFDKVYLLKISSSTVRKRLSTRKSGEFGNIKEAQEEVLSWKDWWEDQMVKRGAVEVDANKGIKEVVKDILRRVNS